MCLDGMATEDRKKSDARTNWWRRKNSLYAGVWKLSQRKPRRWPYSPRRKQKLPDALPSGAMAPRNTTQYLMELVYNELNITAPSSKKDICPPPQHEHTNSYTSVFTDDETMDFQHRDFDSVFFQNEI